MKLFLYLLFLAHQADKKYDAAIHEHRRHYKEEFTTDKNSPLSAADTGFLAFYQPDETYRVTAKVVLTPNASSFKIPTHNPKVQKEYKVYAVLKFKLNGKALELHAYRNVNWEKSEQYKDLLFVPFTDNTNTTTTYGGGRYLDLSISDIKNGKIELDFNKCYNPYCAYKEGYSCPIPPRENSLDISLEAGEKNFMLSEETRQHLREGKW